MQHHLLLLTSIVLCYAFFKICRYSPVACSLAVLLFVVYAHALPSSWTHILALQGAETHHAEETREARDPLCDTHLHEMGV